MIWADADIHLSFGPSVPPWDLVPIGNLLVKNIDWTSPDMKVKELCLRLPCPGEDVDWAHSGRRVRHPVVQEDGVSDCQRPELCILDFGPVDG